MKFSLKLVLSTTIIIAIMFSIGGTYMINQNFNQALDTTVSQFTEQHILERYSLESNMTNYIMAGNDYSDEQLAIFGKRLTNYSSNNKKQISIYSKSNTLIYSNMNIKLNNSRTLSYVGSPENSYILEEINDVTYMIIASSISAMNLDFTLVCAYDITDIFSDRREQITNFFLIDIIILIMSIFALSGLSILLTNPINQLNKLSKKISAGAYDERVPITSTDEIGELSVSFNSMATAIEEKINALTEEIQIREDFISDFSHELRTPMTAIIGYANLLRSSQCSQEIQVKSANYIYKEGKRLEQLSKTLMSLMKLSEEQLTFELCSTKKLETRTKSIIGDTIAPIELTIDFEPCTVNIVEDLILTMLRNLIENARKSEPKDNLIRVIGQLNESTYQIQVSDTGCGIKESDIEKITQAFYMVDKSRSRAYGGAGIGLSLCKKIALIHNTDLDINSTLHVGTTISFELEVAHE